MRRRWWLLAGGAGLIVVIYLVWPSPYCKSAKSLYGLELPECPDGILRQTLDIQGMGLRRGGKGTVLVKATALYTVDKSDSVLRAPVPRLKVDLSLVAGAGKAIPLRPEARPNDADRGWLHRHNGAEARVALPADLNDGDYLLRAEVTTGVAKSTVDMPLPLYAPARIHVLTDRPLYEPGNRVQFRALALRARDLTPIDHRPGRWLVRDPAGNTLLEERAPAGEWGVVEGSFLLDNEAPTGTWTIIWSSGRDLGEAGIKVEPFTLPRFRVSAAAGRSSYRSGDRPGITGSVVYSSGAPVQGARVELEWNVSGSWPPPADWLKGGLPRQANTDAAGRFSLDLPQVPADLQGRVTLDARISATDPAGDRVDGAVSVLLSQDAIQVSAITPLADGLVGGFNNRLYLRVTTADGRPLPGARIRVRKAWLTAGEGTYATLDEDSVARIQIDPGAPVNVVIPAPPFRGSSRTDEVVQRTRAHNLVSNSPASLDDQVEMDRWLALIEPCARLTSDDESEANLALRIAESGAIQSGAATSALGRCVLELVKRRKLPRGEPRLYAVTFELSDPDLPRLELEVEHALNEPPEALTSLFEAAARDARGCLPRGYSGDLAWVLAWQLRPGTRRPAVSWIKAKGDEDTRMPQGVESCILSRVAPRQMDKPAEEETMGVVRYSMEQPGSGDDESRPQPTIMKGYELLVSAEKEGRAVGRTRLRLRPGRIPSLAVRAEPVLARPGDEITIKLIRGPDFRGSLPTVITMEHMGNTKSIKRPKDVKVFRHTLPRDAEGWYSFAAYGNQSLVFVKQGADLLVAVTPEQERYAPGAMARLRVRTHLGQGPAKAAVGLFGVDDSLSQLVPLPGPDALRVVRPKIAMKEKAFGFLDGQALSLGRIQGRYAAEATVMRVASIPRPEELDVVVNASAHTTFDANAVVTDRFYVVLARLHQEARQWEKAAPRSELMRPETMAKLWNQALRACAAQKKVVVDAYGRRLRLHRLPADLLALTDPRQVVTVGTRLPEDVENWPRWVAKRRP